MTERGIFHDIFAFCGTSVPQNGTITWKIRSCDWWLLDVTCQQCLQLTQIALSSDAAGISHVHSRFLTIWLMTSMWNVEWTRNLAGGGMSRGCKFPCWSQISPCISTVESVINTEICKLWMSGCYILWMTQLIRLTWSICGVIILRPR